MKKSRKLGCGFAGVLFKYSTFALSFRAAQVAHGNVTGPMAGIEDRGQWFESHADHMLGTQKKKKNKIKIPGSEIRLLRLLEAYRRAYSMGSLCLFFFFLPLSQNLFRQSILVVMVAMDAKHTMHCRFLNLFFMSEQMLNFAFINTNYT